MAVSPLRAMALLEFLKRWMGDDGEGLREGSYRRAIAHSTLWAINGTVKTATRNNI